MSKALDLRKKSVAELNDELIDLLKAHCSARVQHATNQLTNTSQLGKLRRSIARVRTVLSEKV